MSEANATFVLGEPLPANFNRRDIPWGAKVGDTIAVAPAQFDDGAVFAPSMRVEAIMAELEGETPAEVAPAADPVVTPLVATPPAAATPAPVAASPESARIDKLEALLAEALTALKTPAPKPQEAPPAPPAPTVIDVASLRKNPLAALQAAGIDPATLATYMPGAQMTPEIQVSQSLAAMKAEMEQKFAELAEREAQYTNLQRQAQLATKTDETVKAVDKAKFPTAAKIAAKNPAWVKERILEGIEMARSRNFDLTVEEALTGLESQWANFTSFVIDPPTAAPSAAATPTAAPVVPSEAPTQKQPPRPIRSKWDRADDETSRRTNEVLKEYFVRNSAR
jgi:hypothetical protein